MAQLSQNISGDKDLADLLHKSFVTETGQSFLSFNGCILPGSYQAFAEAIEEFQVRDDDVWVCGFPKSGVTWTQEMVWCIANDLDFDEAELPLDDRFPYFENSAMFQKEEILVKNPGIELGDYVDDSVSFITDKPSPRFIKSHLPVDLLPREMRDGHKKPKIIYVVRNPKDTCISLYHFTVLIQGFSGTFEEFCTLFLNDTIFLGPYWKHVLGFWNKRKDFDLLFLKYEDMKKDLPSVIEKTAAFLGKELTTDQVSSLSEHLSFAKMKDNTAVNWEFKVSMIHLLQHVTREGKFMRKGTTGQWKTEMSPEIIQRFDDWIADNLKDTGLEL